MAGTTIDRLGLNVNTSYALQILLMEEYKRQVDESRVADVITVTTQPIYPDLDMVMGLVNTSHSYANFFPPDSFSDIRRNPFTTYSVGPSFGSLKDRETAEARLNATPCTTQEQVSERNALSNCFSTMSKIGEWISYISGRKGQFLQG